MTDYDNSGALFKNDRKDKPSHPDYNGSLTIGGKSYWLSAWLKKGAKGTFMSLAVKPKDAGAVKTSPQRSTRDDRDYGDAPF